jgi:hypothetical protein
LCETGATFAAPIGLNKILSYLEDPGSSLIRPWVWIVWIGAGPLVGVMFAEWYTFFTSGMLVRAQAIVTQLVFVHALRIRLKSADKQQGGTKSSATPESVPSDAAARQDVQGTIAAGSSSPSERSASPAPSTSAVTPSDLDSSSGSKSKKEGSEDEKQSSKQIIGKINNLVTSDMNAINQAKDFPYLSKCSHR